MFLSLVYRQEVKVLVYFLKMNIGEWAIEGSEQ
jgi:hypothetical protein